MCRTFRGRGSQQEGQRYETSSNVLAARLVGERERVDNGSVHLREEHRLDALDVDDLERVLGAGSECRAAHPRIAPDADDVVEEILGGPLGGVGERERPLDLIPVLGSELRKGDEPTRLYEVRSANAKYERKDARTLPFFSRPIKYVQRWQSARGRSFVGCTCVLSLEFCRRSSISVLSFTDASPSTICTAIPSRSVPRTLRCPVLFP